MTGLIDLLEDADPQGDLLDSDADVFDRGRSVELTLRRLAAASPVVLAIDDLQWLDTVSLRSLRYALRAAGGGTGECPRDRARGGRTCPIVPADRNEELVLGPLSPRGPLCGGAGSGGGRAAARPRPRCELSDGNPLFAIELARSRHAGDGLRAAMPATLRATLASRIGRRHC